LISPPSGQPEQINPQNPDHTVGWRWPRWSRDGRFLFINRFPPDEPRFRFSPPVLYALEMTTRRLYKLAEGVQVLDQTQDGQRLLLGHTSEGGPARLWVMDWPAAGPPTLLTPEGQSDAKGRWSPDGMRILFVSETLIPKSGGLAYRPWLMQADGSRRQLLTQSPGAFPQWLVGGGDRYVLFLEPRTFELQLLDVQADRIWSLGVSVNWDYVSVQLP